MKLEARPYRIGDCLLFDFQREQALDMPPEAFTRLATAAPPGLAWTFWRGAEPIACGGIANQTRGCAEAWALVGARALKRDRGELIAFARAAISNSASRRIQANVRDGWPKACAALGRLGFSFEGVMRKAAWDGADLHLFARVK